MCNFPPVCHNSKNHLTIVNWHGELQFIGFFGIYRESYKLILSWKKIFSQITLALIIPVSFIYLAQIQLTEFFHNEHQHYHRTGSPIYNQIPLHITSEWFTFWLFEAVYLTLIFFLSLLFTSVIVYTIACIYTSKLQMITFTKVMTVVPEVWKRLIVTFLWYFIILFVYERLNVTDIYRAGFSFDATTSSPPHSSTCGYSVDMLLDRVRLHKCSLAIGVSVLEDMYGIKAMIKSKNLIKGKMWVASVIFVKFQICSAAVEMMFEKLVVVDDDTEGGGLGIGSRVSYGLLCLVLRSVLIHIGLVIQTVIYFVCKSYHHENINKSCLADRLELVYLEEYVPLKNKDVQSESFYV